MIRSIEPKSRLSGINRYWELISVLAGRELKVRYRGSFLGVYWSLFNPLMMTALYTIIFGDKFKESYHNSIWEYTLAAFTGLTVIHFFNGSTSQALSSIVSNGSLLNKVKLPVSVFPISIIIANTFQLIVGMLPVLVVLTLIRFPHLASLVNAIAIPLPLISLILISTGIGFLISSLYVFFRDLPFLYELVQFVLMMSSPIFYPAEIVPASIRPFLAINPLYPAIESLRQIVLSGQSPDLFLILRSLLSGIIILAIGWTCFNWLRPKFMDLL
ncbi:ABC transporter permease [Chamaesiphon sp. OTE_75_metabat_556]|jgi:lipopolysaccharide transport system permease protein|uniref:ABC transporter permease n=1 Tax=Chamaesiphon sp. OTE_75_metabat_556 TaxID=2964692 RepID=UPI00286D21E7|nr:ABC transporter permease [Chamaesiphon sp. OTE_75_metabat_556]